MGREIERKFLLASDDWRGQVGHSRRMRQGYLAGPLPGVAGAPRCSVRVRVAGDEAFVNIKSVADGIDRAEYDYPIPVADAVEMLDDLSGRQIDKIRHFVDVDGHRFEIDEFLGDNAGLVVAELELAAVDATYPRPPWLGPEISHLARYYNIRLAEHPFIRWRDDERAGNDAN